MSISLAVALNVALDLGIIAALTYVMSSASRLTPADPATAGAQVRGLKVREQAPEGSAEAPLVLAA